MPTAKKKTTSKKATAAKKTTTKKAVAKKAVVKKAAPKKKVVAKKVVAKKTAPEKKVVPKKAVAKKVAAKKAAPEKKVVAVKTEAEKMAAKRKHAATTPPPSNATLSGGLKPYTVGKGEEYMSKEQKSHFRELLRAWKRELMEEVDRTVHHMQDDAANFPDPNDRATQESEFSLELRTRDRERKLIKKIDEAINHIDDDEYGYCDSCGIEIGIRRLEARPTAKLCIDCKTLDEIREKTRT